jgi:hypothetical protein
MESGEFVDEMEELINGGSAPVVAAGSASAVVLLAAGGGAAAPGAAIPAGVAAPVAGAGAGAGAGAVRAMRWTNNTSGFVLRRIAATMAADLIRFSRTRMSMLWPKPLRSIVGRLLPPLKWTTT